MRAPNHLVCCPMSKYPPPLLICLIFLLFCSPHVLASLEADIPEIRDCVGRTAPTDDFLRVSDPAASCKRKLKIRAAADPPWLKDGEVNAVFEQSAVGPNGPADKYSYEGFQIRIVRREVVLRHEMTYLKDFNAKPYENSVHDSNCNADSNPYTASCGLAYDKAGYIVPLSQGFCCDCTPCYLGKCGPNWRVKACSLQATKVAACLRMDSLYYAGYIIHPTAQLSYALDVQVWGNMSDYINGSRVYTRHPVSTVVTISPDFPQLYNATDEIIVMFEGKTVDLSPMGAVAKDNITTKMVFIPTTPESHERVKAGSAEWVFLNPSSVSVDGTRCNKVGTSYQAFASQVNACNLDVGTCLERQLNDFRAIDLKVMEDGAVGSFLGPNYGNFILQALPDGGNYIAYPAGVTPANAMLNIVINADKLILLTAALKGNITGIRRVPPELGLVPRRHTTGGNGSPPPLASPTAEGNSSNADDRRLLLHGIAVEVTNTDGDASHFQLSIDRCTENMRQDPITPLWVALTSKQVYVVTFLVMAASLAPTDTLASCRITLRNYEGVVMETRTFSWELATTNPCDQCNFFTISRNFREGCASLIVLNLITLILLTVVTVVLLRRVWRRLSLKLSWGNKNPMRGRGADQRLPYTSPAQATAAPAPSRVAPAANAQWVAVQAPLAAQQAYINAAQITQQHQLNEQRMILRAQHQHQQTEEMARQQYLGSMPQGARCYHYPVEERLQHQPRGYGFSTNHNPYGSEDSYYDEFPPSPAYDIVDDVADYRQPRSMQECRHAYATHVMATPPLEEEIEDVMSDSSSVWDQ